MFRIVFHTPEIPPNTGNAIRLAANTGAELHLVEPLGFSLDARNVRRAGLDYHDLARVHVHADLAAAWRALLPAAVYAFSTTATRCYTDVAYAPGDVLLFGCESAGLPPEVEHAPEVSDRVRLPMLPTSRSLNLANAAAVAMYEAWRQHGFRNPDGSGSGRVSSSGSPAHPA
ncbi:tRNA (cytidine(34)-2'-O)-methyltransferase [Pseudonocardia sp. H11422]|uniref:tRNA (cytidine(34)-2'-O)-methyltransferase n=1 Tax=Pseudonocardia sp. H11422 TaxID=2835866 RepID=UPI001BDBF686|nr:tRNA (cytidine(34)-2'-O)-methyltransferase [Pseudonocardia sp. H11422]